MRPVLFTCRCSSMQHVFVVSADGEDLFLEMHLSPLPFMQRLKRTWDYLFGKRCKYGDWEEIILDPLSALELGDLLTKWCQGPYPDFGPNDVH